MSEWSYIKIPRKLGDQAGSIRIQNENSTSDRVRKVAGMPLQITCLYLAFTDIAIFALDLRLLADRVKCSFY